MLPESIAEQQRIWEKRQSIRRAIEAGALQKDLARMFGVSPSRVHQIYMDALRQKEKPPIQGFLNRSIAINSPEHAREYIETLDVFARR